MKFSNQDLAKFIMIIEELDGVEVKKIKRDVITYKVKSERKHKIVNLHTLCVEAMSKLSKKYKLYITVKNDRASFKIDSFRMECDIKDYVNTIIFITILKFSK